jgi:hypothetical protein
MPRRIIPVHTALKTAWDLGIEAQLGCGVRQSAEEFYVAVTTDDRDPHVAIRRPGHGRPVGDRLLSQRDQFGPDSWEYPAVVEGHVDLFFLWMSRGGRVIEVPVLPAVTAVLAEHGFRANAGTRSVAVVDAGAFGRAVEELMCR